MTAVPDLEVEVLANLTQAAARLAGRGEWANGHDVLLYGLRRAEVLRREGNTWGADLVVHYRQAVNDYCTRHGAR